MNPIRTALAATLLFALPAMAQEAPTPTLTASGDGVVMVTPDIAIVTLGVTTRAATAGAALAGNSADAAKVIAAIQGSGVSDKDIGTSNFSIDPIYPPDRDQPTDKPPQIQGYQVTNEVRVTIRDIAQSGSILDKVVSAGANRVTGISFDVADRTAANDAALKAAIVDARRKAELMAEAAGVRLVRILSVAASEGGYPTPMFARAAIAGSPPVMPGQQAASTSATVTFEIAPQ